jgi:hypothetical protein
MTQSFWASKSEHLCLYRLATGRFAKPRLFLLSTSHYPAYLLFFHKEIERIGGMETLEKYFFSSAANSGGKQNKKGPRMFTRLFSGAFHPWIHLGFALEFRDQVTLAEAFAQAAIHAGEELGSAFPDNWPTVPSAKSHARRRSSQTIDTDASFIDPRRTQVSASNMTGMMGNLYSNTTPLTFSTSVTTGSATSPTSRCWRFTPNFVNPKTLKSQLTIRTCPSTIV